MASRFREARLGCVLSVRDAGKLFRVSERTIRNWEAGRVLVPHAAFKLLRILRGYELPGAAWQGWRLVGDTLWSPEGRGFRADEHRWWWLTVSMAQQFRVLLAREREREAASSGLPAPAALGASLAPLAVPVLPSTASPVDSPGPSAEIPSPPATTPPPTGGISPRVRRFLPSCSNTGVGGKPPVVVL
jgi:hypothetical protein